MKWLIFTDENYFWVLINLFSIFSMPLFLKTKTLQKRKRCEDGRSLHWNFNLTRLASLFGGEREIFSIFLRPIIFSIRSVQGRCMPIQIPMRKFSFFWVFFSVCLFLTALFKLIKRQSFDKLLQFQLIVSIDKVTRDNSLRKCTKVKDWKWENRLARFL